MKFTSQAGALCSAIKKAKAATSNSVLPIVAYVKMSVVKDRLELCGNDTRMFVETFLSVKGEEDGSICAPAQRMHDVLAGLPSGAEVYVVNKKNKMAVDWGSGKAQFPTLSSDDFLTWVWGEYDTHSDVDKADLVSAIRSVSFASTNDSTRPMMSGINFLVSEEDCRMSVRCAKSALVCEVKDLCAYDSAGCSMTVDVSLLERAMSTVSSLNSETVSLSIGSKCLVLECTEDATRIGIVPIEGKYPTIANLFAVAQSGNIELMFDTDSMRKALRRLSVNMDTVSTQCKMSLADSMSLEAILSVEDEMSGASAEEVVQVTSPSSVNNGHLIAFKLTDVRKILDCVKESSMTWRISDFQKPILITAGNYQCITAPMMTIDKKKTIHSGVTV